MSKPTCTTDMYGTKCWYLNGKRQRTDGPAVEYTDGEKEWYLNGKLHREDGPAVINYDGSEEWYINGKRHREDGPAFINSNGSESWYINGEVVNNTLLQNFFTLFSLTMIRFKSLINFCIFKKD